MNVRAFVFPLLCLAYQTAGQPPQPAPQYFRYQRAVELPEASATGQSCVTLDTSVFMHAANNLSDVRLFSGTHEVPYALQSAVLDSVPRQEQPSLMNLGTRADHVVFDVRVASPSYSTVELSIDKQNFVASVDVSGSQSASDSGATRLGTFTIFDLTNQQLHRSTVLHLPPSTFPYLHFTVTGPIAPEDVKGATVLEAPARSSVYVTVAETHGLTQRGRQSIASFSLSEHVPVDRAEFIPATSTGNFSRGVSIATSAQDRRAPPVGVGNIYRIHTTQGGRQIDQEQYTVDAGGFPSSDTLRVSWTITVDNGDDVPLAMQSVHLQMRARTLCFDATTGTSYTLYYGDSTLVPPRYDYASLFQPQDRPNTVVLAPEQRNANLQQRADTRPFTERHPALLWIALVVVIGVLGFIALRTASRVQIP